MPTRTARAEERATQIRQYRADLRRAVEAPWHDHAACKNTPATWWFADSDGKASQAATAICRRACPVRAQCLDHALEFEPYGIWGGMTQRQLAKVRNGRGIGTAPSFTP